ncbi:MAG: hypothetical protein M3246_07665 [Actinomycetota bacterium]|nr:hypothetical protein [Actinomycetota bacterium]
MDGTKFRPWLGSEKLARTRVVVLLGGVLVLIAFAAGCAGDDKAQDDAKDQTAEQTEERAGATSQEGTKGGGGGGTRSQQATLEIRGDPGIEFSGSCTVGDEETEISGQAPESFAYDLRGRRLDCEISRERADGNLQLVFTAGENTRAVQQISGGTLRLTYDNGSISFSSGGQASSSSTQVVSVSSQSGSSSVSVSSP